MWDSELNIGAPYTTYYPLSFGCDDEFGLCNVVAAMMRGQDVFDKQGKTSVASTDFGE